MPSRAWASPNLGLDACGCAIRSLGRRHFAQFFVNSSEVDLGHHSLRLQSLGSPVLVHCFGESSRFLERPPEADMEARPLFRGQLDRSLPARDCRAVLLPLHLEVGQLLPEPRIFRIKIDRVFEPWLGFGKLTVDSQCNADLQVAVGQVGLEPKCFQIGATCLCASLQSLQYIAQIVMMNGEIRLEPDRLLAVYQSLLGLTAVKQDQGKPATGRGVPGRQLEARRRCSSASSLLAQFAQHHCEVPVSLGEIRPQFEGATEVCDRFTGTAQRLNRQSESAKGFGIIRIEF